MTKQSAKDEIWQIAAEFKRTFSIECKPHFVGLWDAVNSVGLMPQFFNAPYSDADSAPTCAFNIEGRNEW